MGTEWSADRETLIPPPPDGLTLDSHFGAFCVLELHQLGSRGTARRLSKASDMAISLLTAIAEIPHVGSLMFPTL